MRKLPKFFDRIKVSHNKDFAAQFRDEGLLRYVHDFALTNTSELLGAVKKEFKKVAFVGNNPDTFILNTPSNVRFEHFFVCDPSIKNLEVSLDRIHKIQTEKNLKFPVYPICLEEEIWPFGEESIDLIISSLNLQWTNDIHAALSRMLASLIPDGALIGSIFGEDTLEELRIAFTLAENERSGGVSQHTSPLMTAVDFGNLFARSNYNLPTIYSEKVNLLFNDAFEVMDFLQKIGENNALLNPRKDVQRDVIFAMAAIYQHMFKHQEHKDKVFATFQIVNFLGWKYHESQQKPKKRGSAEFSLKELQKEIYDSLEPGEAKPQTVAGTIEVSESEDEKDQKSSSNKKDQPK